MPTPDSPDRVPVLKLHINRYDFTIPSRYAPGNPLTEGEAQALNQLMMENIRNNVAPWIRKAEAEAPRGGIPLAEHEALQKRIWNYATNYLFLARTRTRPVSAIEAAIDELAMAQAEREGNLQGLAPTDPAVIGRYHQLRADSTIRAVARQVVADRAKLTSSTLEDILGDTP